MKPSTVTVNGTVYDSRTGKPLRRERTAETAKKHTAQQVHTQTQRSRTLNRRYVKREDVVKHAAPILTSVPTTSAPRRTVAPAISVHKRPVAPTRATTHRQVAKFTPVQPRTTHAPQKTSADVAPTPHALTTAAHAKLQKPAAATPRPSHVIKQESIHKAVAQSTPKAHKKDVKQKKHRGKVQRFAGFASAALAIVLLGGYLTYLNMPAISTKVAAAQAGIDATYPGYSPSGYSLSGPVAYDQGSVSMKFAANAGPQSYTLTQKDSSWDSSALLQNDVMPTVGTRYTTTTASGLTIYNYLNTAVWVNNGILYTLSGTNDLSDSQVQHIATSL